MKGLCRQLRIRPPCGKRSKGQQHLPDSKPDFFGRVYLFHQQMAQWGMLIRWGREPLETKVLALNHESRILGQWSNPVSVQGRAKPVLHGRNSTESNLFHDGETTYRVGWMSKNPTLRLKSKELCLEMSEDGKLNFFRRRRFLRHRKEELALEFPGLHFNWSSMGKAKRRTVNLGSPSGHNAFLSGAAGGRQS